MKPKLLLLHGALGTRNQFDGLRPFLQDHFDLYDFNFEGHGGVPTHNDYTISLFSDNAEAFMKENNLEGVGVFGYSMGGYVALKLELENPGTFQNIVTLGTKFDWTPESAAKEVKMLNPTVIEEKVPKFAEKLNSDHLPLDWKSVMQQTADMMLRLGNGAALTQGNFQGIHCKVQLGLGAEDTMVSLSETEQILQWLPNAELKVLDGIPHPIEKANPEQVSNFIVSSLT